MPKGDRMFVNVDFEGGRRLRCDIAAIQEIEQLTGKPLGQVLGDLKSLGIHTLIICLYACLKHEDASLNLNLVRKRLEKHLDSGKALKPLIKGLNDALEGSGVFQGIDDDEEDVPVRPPAAATTTAKTEG